MAAELESRDDGRLRILRLNRPDQRNALNGPLLGALVAAFREAAQDDDVWAIALTGNGPAFCAGLDLGSSREAAVTAADDGANGSDDAAYHHFSLLMRVECEKPILAGINGAAVGLGLALAMNADIRIAAPSARFHPGYARMATSPDGGATWTLTRALGYERAMRFLLEQRMVPAAEALSIGLVSQVATSDDAFETELLEYGRMLAQVAPRAAQQTKRLLVRVDQPPGLDAHLDAEVALALQGLASADGAEAVRAMFSGERPEFTGH